MLTHWTEPALTMIAVRSFGDGEASVRSNVSHEGFEVTAAQSSTSVMKIGDQLINTANTSSTHCIGTGRTTTLQNKNSSQMQPPQSILPKEESRNNPAVALFRTRSSLSSLARSMFYHHSAPNRAFAELEEEEEENDKNDEDVFQSEHLGESRQYWRDIILGVNDGLVSTFLLVAGVTGANLSNEDILLTAIAGMIAGAISMSAGEYIATKTQEEVFEGEVGIERKHVARHRERELGELRECFEKIGIVSNNDNDKEEVEDINRRLLAFYSHRDNAHLLAHMVLEFGILEDEKRNPVIAASVAFVLFTCGALPSVLPYTFIDDITVAFIVAGIATLTGLLAVGAIKTWATRGNLWNAAIENLAVSAGGGAVAFAIGYAFQQLVRGDVDHDL